MKKLLIALLVAGAAASVHASEYGCKVLLCLSNPASNGGPKGFAACVPPIDQLFHDLRKGRPFPTCDLADGNNGSSYARAVWNPYDPCPAGLQPAVPGAHVVQGQRKADHGSARKPFRWGLYKVKGQPQVSEPRNDSGDGLGPRACVGKSVGTYSLDSNYEGHIVSVFDLVVWQPAQSPRAIDVFIDDTWRQRVRW